MSTSTLMHMPCIVLNDLQAQPRNETENQTQGPCGLARQVAQATDEVEASLEVGCLSELKGLAVSSVSSGILKPERASEDPDSGIV